MSNSSSREYSPDWLRNVKAPPVFTLSSSSSDEDDQLPISSVLVNSLPTKAAGSNIVDMKVAKGLKQLTKPQEPKTSVWTLPSDSDYNLYDLETSQHPKEEDKDHHVLDTLEVSSLKGPSKLKSPKKRLKMEPTETKVMKQENDDVELKDLERETTEKQTGPYISSSRLPLVLADKVQRSKVLVECEGESIDLSGDLGCVGRVVISDSPSGSQDMLLDLKGTMYKTTIIPSRTLCVVSFGQSEAKIEAIMNDFIQLKPESNVYEAETMVEGTLEGFSFDSEDEGDNHTIRQTDENEETNRKGRGKSEKTSDISKRKGKQAPAAAKKKVKKKGPVAKKSKTKK